MNNEKELRIRTLSSLAKVFHDRIYGKSCRSLLAARGQEVSFQVAYMAKLEGFQKRDYEIKIETDLDVVPELYSVENVPAHLAAYPNRNDSNYITHSSGLFPDPLVPVDAENATVTAVTGRWHSLWVTLPIPESQRAGEFYIKLSFIRDGKAAASTRLSVRVGSFALPPQKLLFTQWFHCDCIADAHGVEVFSEEHWALIEKYMRLAARHGMNVILTPVLTPPLDTAVGHERPTVQLVEITRHEDSTYSFDFSLLDRYVTLAKSIGINIFEINHMFTQWGARYAPKVVAVTENGEERIFGWETPADSAEYKEFLSCLIPALIEHLEAIGVSRNEILFHVSDEPEATHHLESYSKAVEILRPLIKGCKHIDALSDFDFFKGSLLDIPAVAIDARVEDFLKISKDIWCYYCCVQNIDVSNRFFSMPSARNRILGVIMYRHGIKGFLHWGYNFYYSQFSLKKLDPWRETDGGEAFPSGDAFSVYPYGNDVIPSLRQKVFSNALEDIRLLSLVEERIGREATVARLEEIAGMPIDFKHYPTADTFFDELYKFIFDILDEK